MNDPLTLFGLVLSSPAVQPSNANDVAIHLPSALSLLLQNRGVARVYDIVESAQLQGDANLSHVEKHRVSRATTVLHQWSVRISALLSSFTSKQRESIDFEQMRAKQHYNWAAACFVRVTVEQAYAAAQKDVKGWCNLLLLALRNGGQSGGDGAHHAFAQDLIGALVRILTLSKAYPALQRDLTQASLAKTITTVLDFLGNAPSDDTESILSVLADFQLLLRAFPGAIKSHSDRVEMVCLQLALRVNADPAIPKAASRVLLNMARVNREKADSANSSSGKSLGGMANEAIVVGRVCATLQEVINAVFQPVSSVDKGVPDERGAIAAPAAATIPPIVLPSLPSASYADVLPTRLSYISSLVHMLREMIDTTTYGFSSAPILKLIRSIYSGASSVMYLDSSDFGPNDNGNSALARAAHLLCLDANNILMALLNRQGLVTDLGFLWKICLKAFELSAEQAELRLSAYALLAKSVRILGGETLMTLGNDKLIDFVCRDMAIHSRSSSSMPRPPTGQSGWSTKKRKLDTNDGTTRNSENDLDNSAVVWDTRLAALDLTNTILLYTSATPTPTSIHLRLVQALLRNLLDTFVIPALPPTISPLSALRKGPTFASPIHSYQYAALECLLASVEAQCGINRVADVVVLAIRLFEGFLHHSDLQIQKLCTKALIVTDLIIHPRLPRFDYTPLSIDPATSTATSAPLFSAWNDSPAPNDAVNPLSQTSPMDVPPSPAKPPASPLPPSPKLTLPVAEAQPVVENVQRASVKRPAEEMIDFPEENSEDFLMDFPAVDPASSDAKPPSSHLPVPAEVNPSVNDTPGISVKPPAEALINSVEDDDDDDMEIPAINLASSDEEEEENWMGGT